MGTILSRVGQLMVKVYLDTGAVRVTWAMRMHPEHAKDRLTGWMGWWEAETG